MSTVKENGKIELSEQWEWTSGDFSKGESLLVEKESCAYYRRALETGEHIALEATDMGRPLHERYGFVKMEDEMELI